MIKNKKILFVNVPGSSNKGDIAVTIGHIMGIKHFIPEAEITLWSGNVAVDQIYEVYGVRVQAHPWYIRKREKRNKYHDWQNQISKGKVLDMLPKFANLIISLPLIFRTCMSAFNSTKEKPAVTKCGLMEYDIILDTIPDRLNEPFHGSLECFAVLYITFMARKLFKIPIMLGPSSIGPMNSLLLKTFARYVLNNVDVIATRDQKSFLYLTHLGITKPKLLSLSDMAFLLPAASSEKVTSTMHELNLEAGTNPIIGIVPRMHIWENAAQYYSLIAQFADWLINEYNAVVCLIPNEIGMGVYWNDEIICMEIYNRIVNQTAVRILSGSNDVQLLSGLLGKLDIVVSWKLHGAVLATSNFIPTVAVSYGDKFNELFNNALQLPELIVDLRKIPLENLSSAINEKFEFAWNNRQFITTKLKKNVVKLRELALSYSKYVSEMLDKAA